MSFGCRKGSKFHLISWQSRKQRQVAASSLVAEAIAAGSGLAAAIHLQTLMRQVGVSCLPIRLVIDSKGLHRNVATQKTPRDLSAGVAIHQQRLDYEADVVDGIVWIQGTENPCDSLTKPLTGEPSSLLNEMMALGELPVDITDVRFYGPALDEEH